MLQDFTGADVERIRALADEIETTTGVVPFGDDAWTGMHAVRGRDRGLLTSDGGAYAHLAHHHAVEWSLELALRPGAADVRAQLLAAALEVVGREGGGHVTFWAHGAADADDALALEAGFTRERELLQMRVALPLGDPVRWRSVDDYENEIDIEASVPPDAAIAKRDGNKVRLVLGVLIAEKLSADPTALRYRYQATG